MSQRWLVDLSQYNRQEDDLLKKGRNTETQIANLNKKNDFNQVLEYGYSLGFIFKERYFFLFPLPLFSRECQTTLSYRQGPEC